MRQSQLQDHAARGGRRQHGKYFAGGRGERNKDVTNTFQQEPGDKGQGEHYPGQQQQSADSALRLLAKEKYVAGGREKLYNCRLSCKAFLYPMGRDVNPGEISSILYRLSVRDIRLFWWDL